MGHIYVIKLTDYPVPKIKLFKTDSIIHLIRLSLDKQFSIGLSGFGLPKVSGLSLLKAIYIDFVPLKLKWNWP